MLFNSYAFIFGFLPIVLTAYTLLSFSGRNRAAVIWLAAASLFFYSFGHWHFLPILLCSLAVNFALGQMIARAQPARARNALLALGLSANLGALIWYKYAGFLGQIAGLETGFAPLILPLGISFFTFQQIAYLVDTWRGKNHNQDPVTYCLFVSFFPHIIAGPLVHHAEMIPQFNGKWRHSLSEYWSLGLSIFVIGLFKKSCLADPLGTFATPVFEAASSSSGAIGFVDAWGGALAYSLQLYFDFSAYSDMAIGLGLLFGVRLPANFLSPYRATSIIDFWRRWHVTLSRFLRDYLYIPLGGNRHGMVRHYINLFITMVLGGIWHGAGWTFIAWGALHGSLLIVNHIWRSLSLIRLWQPLSWALTFVSVVIGWVFFRSETMPAALNMLNSMLLLDGRLHLRGDLASYVGSISDTLSAIGLSIDSTPPIFRLRAGILWLVIGLGIVLLLPNAQHFMERYKSAIPLGRKIGPAPLPIRWRPSAAWSFVMAILLLAALLRLRSPSEFLYFQF